MKPSIFLSYPKPYLKSQQEFIEKLILYLESRELKPRTLGVTDYNMEAPLVAIKNIMKECQGLIAVAFKRTVVSEGVEKPNSDMELESKKLTNVWLTSPYCQIEPAMAFQMDLPVLILKEKDVLAEGILERGVLGAYMPEFSLENSPTLYFNTPEFKALMIQWEEKIRKVNM